MGIRHAQGQGGPDVPGQGPPPGARCRCLTIHLVRRGEPVVVVVVVVVGCVCLQKHRRASHSAAEVVSGRSLGSAPSHPGRACSESRGTYALRWGPKPF